MYRIYADGELLHDPQLVSEGCGVLSPKVTKELNKAGSLQFVMPPNNNSYDSINTLSSMITVYNDDKEIFRGRVLNDEKDFYNQKNVYCEGDLALLLDSVVRPYSYSGAPAELFRKYIKEHNAVMDAQSQTDKTFKMGKVDVVVQTDIADENGELDADADTNTVGCENYNYPQTLDEINEKLINNIGGYIKTYKKGDDYYIDWTSKSGGSSSQIIEFGVNLLDITEHVSAEEIYTVLIPIGAPLKDSEGNELKTKTNIKDVNNNKDYIVNANGVSLFGWIEHKEEWTEVSNKTQLKRLGTALLNKTIEAAMTLNVKAIDLHLLNVDVDQIEVGDYVTVISIPHNINREIQCTKIVYDLTNPDQTEYTFGENHTSLTGQQVNTNKNTQSLTSIVTNADGTIIEGGEV